MHVRSTDAGLEVLAPAKLNLFLEILGKRSDGFHEIETLMYPIGLYDTLVFRDDPGCQVSLTCEQDASEAGASSANDVLPAGADNLVVRAVELIRRRLGVTKGARLRLIKRIPLAAGLAGGSSDAAAALFAANRVWQLGLGREALAALAAELGSDIPFFLHGGPAVCRGRGEIIERTGGLGELHFVVARPPAGLSTADVYRACRPSAEARRVGGLIDALRCGSLARAAGCLHNGLQAAAESLSPWIARLSREFGRLDFLGHRMSGSGTSYFGLCRHARQARRLAALLRARGVGRVYAVQGTC
ncbi:MAG TPA: 4-(cytidine 5'-diphospho)-2-C-methyl-D-erythritol kinase [Pirellulales bacterium]|jgi:4-diphosphocytidyl-2-C-methyl-D-erythritol kinase|nr:4-(cytidine 5'-diphospho)-2-C-methyl-D-erythritol kinase [Pirellulales bacterium]